jgi:isoquinoline 1-oxidoreductase beta subunit
MSKLKTIARRTFLIGSAAVAGGVAFGVYSQGTPHPCANVFAANVCAVLPGRPVRSSRFGF